MEEISQLPAFAAVIVAAGMGARAGQAVPKQFAIWRGKPVIRHSAEALAEAGADPIVVVIPENGEALAQAALQGIAGISFVTGGPSRQDSVRIGLEAIANLNLEYVLIHDAARPKLPFRVINRVLSALVSNSGAIPVLPVVDSLAIDTDGIMSGSADRDRLRRVQTPQGFRFADILAAHHAWVGETNAGDDAQIMLAAGGTIAHVEGEEALKKLTFFEDFITDVPSYRTGMGYDVHRLAAGEELWLGGIKIDHHKGLVGHSDADVGLHAIVDALLGAIAAGDIGDHFPPSDDRWKGAASSRFLEHAGSLVCDAGYRIGNIDLTIICEAPKIGPHRLNIRNSIAGLLGIDSACVSVKATTTERLGFTGREEGIAAQAVATVVKR